VDDALPAQRAGTLGAFRSRDFRLLWGGQTISFVGDAAFIVALGWRVTDLTGDAGSLGFVLALYSLGLLTTLLWGGVLADRHSRRLLMIGSDLARAVLVGVLAGLEFSGHLTMTSIMILAAAIGLADGFFHPAFGGIVPLVVEQPFLASANSMINAARQVSAVFGPAVAAGLYGTAGPSTVWTLDALSFVASALLLWQARPRAMEPAPREGAFRELAAGFRYVMNVAWIWSGIFVASFILMVAMSPYIALLPQLVRDQYHRGVGSYGLLFSLMSVGMVAGSLLYARWNPRRNRVLLCFAAFGLNDLGMVVVALSPWYPLACVAVVWRGLGIGLGIAAWFTLVTELVPENYLSRVLSLDAFGSFALTPIGYVFAGALAGAFTPREIIAVGGTLGCMLWFVPLFYRSVRAAA
jgi:MFS family permease